MYSRDCTSVCINLQSAHTAERLGPFASYTCQERMIAKLTRCIAQVRHLVRVETDLGRAQRLAAEEQARAPLPTLTFRHSQLTVSRQ